MSSISSESFLAMKRHPCAIVERREDGHGRGDAMLRLFGEGGLVYGCPERWPLPLSASALTPPGLPCLLPPSRSSADPFTVCYLNHLLSRRKSQGCICLPLHLYPLLFNYFSSSSHFTLLYSSTSSFVLIFTHPHLHISISSTCPS